MQNWMYNWMYKMSMFTPFTRETLVISSCCTNLAGHVTFRLTSDTHHWKLHGDVVKNYKLHAQDEKVVCLNFVFLYF